MFDDLVDKSKFEHLEEECDKDCSGDCAVGCKCTGSCQPEAMEDELPISFCKDIKGLTLEKQIQLKYELGQNIQKFYMPKYAYDCLEFYKETSIIGVYRFHVSLGTRCLELLSNLRTILIRKLNNSGKAIEYIELVELY